MERLTIEDIKIDEHTTRRTIIDSSAVRDHAMEFYWRLKAYEDTGLEPEEIVAAANRRHDCKIDCLLKKYNELYDAVADLGGIGHLRELVQAEKDGLLVILPCKAGDEVYKIFCGEIVPAYIGKVEINAYTNPRIWVQVETYFSAKQDYRFDLSCGRDFYLTREEAEAALEAQKGGDEG